MSEPKYKRHQRVAYEPRISLGPIAPRRVGTVAQEPCFWGGCYRYSINFDDGADRVGVEEFSLSIVSTTEGDGR